MIWRKKARFDWKADLQWQHERSELHDGYDRNFDQDRDTKDIDDKR